MDEAMQGEFRPPYLSFTTFWSFIEELTTRPLPPKIDRSLMRSKSGSDQVGLTAAMKAFGLIDSSQAVTGLRGLAATDEAGRIQWLALQIQKHYALQMKVSAENGTEHQLRDSFKEGFGLESSETIRKAMTFFLHAVRTAGIEVSPHFPSTRSGSGAPGAPKPRRASRRKPQASPPKDTAKEEKVGNFTVTGDVYELTMESGPVVTFAVAMNVMEASVEDRDFVFAIIDKLRGYSEKKAETSGSEENAARRETETTEDSL